MAMSLPATKAKADGIYNAQEVALTQRQAAYELSHGRYFQGLDTHSVLPADGNETAADFAHKPTDQEETWTPSDFPAISPASLKIDVYGGELVGYVATLSFVYGGVLWQKAHGYGDFTHLDHDWQEVTE